MIAYISNEEILAFILRVILGILFFFQGYDKIFNVKMKGVIETFQFELGVIHIPKWLLISSAYFTSYIELIAGVLLIIGFLKTYALYLVGLDLIIVTIAFSLMKPMWDMQLLFPRLVILSILLYLPTNCDLFSLDQLFRFCFPLI